METNSTPNNKENNILIDVEQVFASKNPALLKIIPKFLINYLKRIVHQDEINKFLLEKGHLKGAEFGRSILDDLFGAKYTTIGLDKLPSEGRFIFASNHPLGGLDGIALLVAVSEKYPELKFPVNDILLNLKPLDNIFVPVNKHGGHSKDAARLIEDAYKSDAQVLMFPAGLVSRKQKGVIRDLEWKNNFVRKAIQHQRDIIPVHITGRNTNFFYRLANLRKLLGIKSNIEMLYLPDEMFKQFNENLTIRFGAPVSWKTIKETGDLETWTRKIKDMSYELAKNH
ncbi:MAG: glycerol acyltransferase [Anaerophaga sp.]|uniref:1-acyl-sn-glycerol-3-phosphate acyltransferase n=1 Tax=Anaerophaga thermohalophila TaxID=177400 RepID=UPI000237CFDE|nr:1-acyl-sn-glycerol-3-phosphate acyltransferase [Anaerophaga thermohalophila]MBZ4675646.1 glycerol acyltransferase [Anaerophaga sp.]